jgi:phage terminase large subunit GpA-like protein
VLEFERVPGVDLALDRDLALIGARESLRRTAGIWAPVRELSISEWAELYRMLSPESSAEPGRWYNYRTPYLVEIMDAISDPFVEEIVVVAASQSGKTELILNIIGYFVDYDPSPIMVVQPTKEMAEAISKDRIVPMIRDTPALAAKFGEMKSRDSSDTILHKKFPGGHLTLVGANSPAGLASRPIRIVLTDEEDRYPASAGSEGNPSDLAWKRATRFWNRKRIRVSTPTDEDTSPIWKAYLRGTQEEWCLQCPDCGHYQYPKFTEIMFDSLSMACKCCGCINAERDWKRNPAKYVAGNPEALKSRRIRSFHFGAQTTGWIGWQDLINEFLDAKDKGPEYLQVFINTRLAETWKDQAKEIAASVVLDRQSEYEEGVVPPETLLLTGGVDVQESSFYWTVRAWGPGLTSWNVAHGQTLDWADIERVMNREWKGPGGTYQVNLCAVDSGDQTDEVYEFCFLNSEWAIPVKGASSSMHSYYRISVIDRPNNKAHGTQFVLVNTQQYKSLIANRLMRENGRGSWMVHADCDEDYAAQITAEHKVKKIRNGREVYLWEPKTERAQNHWLDAEVYAACAADLMQIRHLDEEEGTDDAETRGHGDAGNQKASPGAPAGGQDVQAGSWINAGNWLS